MERNQNGYPNGSSPMPVPNGSTQGRTRCDGTRGGESGRTLGNGSQGCNIDGLPIGYAYVPIQRFRMLYSAENALSHGTLFEELYLPFGVYGK